MKLSPVAVPSLFNLAKLKDLRWNCTALHGYETIAPTRPLPHRKRGEGRKNKKAGVTASLFTLSCNWRYCANRLAGSTLTPGPCDDEIATRWM